MEVFPDKIIRSSVGKIKRNLKMTDFQEVGIDSILYTQQNCMTLVSFSSAEDALSNDVKKYETFRSQRTENLPFRFFGTPGI